MVYTATQFTAGFVQCGVSETGGVCCVSLELALCETIDVCVCERERETIDVCV